MKLRYLNDQALAQVGPMMVRATDDGVVKYDSSSTYHAPLTTRYKHSPTGFTPCTKKLSQLSGCQGIKRKA